MKEDATAQMGRGATRELERVAASLGELKEAATQFEHVCDVQCGGVLFALPALIANGLLFNSQKYFDIPKGYYGLLSLLVILASLVLLRIRSIEQVKGLCPGELGKVVGLDRIPEVKTLRRKIDVLSTGSVKKWQHGLTTKWLKETGDLAGFLYVDGHVRVYNGKKAKLPRRYVARQRLCLRGMVDYWVNSAIGSPFFLVSTAQTDGLLAMLRKEIVPKLLTDVPNQPSERALKCNPYLYRFVLIFDREGYSPEFMSQMWEKRISCITYKKNAEENWPEKEFIKEEVTMPNGEHVEMELAERGRYLVSGKIWVREIRKLTNTGKQTSMVSTEYGSESRLLAAAMFSRWSQENFFKYMRQHFGIDKILEYGAEELDATTRVVNPPYRELDKQVKSVVSKLNRLHAKFGALTLSDIEERKVREYERKKSELKEEIEVRQGEAEDLKKQRKDTKRYVKIMELPEDERITKLVENRKQIMDTIKMIAYRAETSLATLIRPGMSYHHRDEAKTILRHIFESSVDLRPDEAQKVLEVSLHNMANPLFDKIAKNLCSQLNKTKTKYPGTNLRLVYKMVSEESSRQIAGRQG